MLRGALSTVFTVLLIGTLLLGPCAACSSPQPVASSHYCCQKKQGPMPDHCGKPTPQPARQSCATHDHGSNYEKPDWNAVKVVVAAAYGYETAASTTLLAASFERVEVAPLVSAPPALFVLHSSFLI